MKCCLCCCLKGINLTMVLPRTQVPDDTVKAFKEAQVAASVSNFNKATFESKAQDIVPMMTIPLVQACIR